jgi:hypothetical protein
VSMHTQATRLLGAAALVISLASCDSATTPTPTQPSSRPPNPPPTDVTVSGTVFEFTATGERRPVPNLRLKVLASGPYDGAVDGIALADTVTDTQGRYTITNVTAYFLFFQTAPGSDYRFLCDWWPIHLRFPFTDLPVVHAAWSGNRPPPNMGLTSTFVYGTVSERDAGSLQPVAGATVTLDEGVPDPPATTTATGFYMICSMVGADQTGTITASKPGYNPVTREFRNESEINLELTRR